MSDKTYPSTIDPTRVPRHVAIIMDGNGRWAKEHGQQRALGHEQGVITIREVNEAADDLGVKYLTLYAFSTENWNRPQQEVDLLMALVASAIVRETPAMLKNNVRLTAIGDLDRMPALARERIEQTRQATAHCTGLVMCLALSYSGRWEIVEACRRLARQAAAGQLNPDDIDEALLATQLTTADMPDPDLLIRTGGDLRLSNYLLWQTAYSELYFSPKYWPEFTRDDFIEAIAEYQRRERRYGKTSEQVANK